MINDESNNCYYFTVKNLSELNSLGWLQGKKEAIINITIIIIMIIIIIKIIIIMTFKML